LIKDEFAIPGCDDPANYSYINRYAIDEIQELIAIGNDISACCP